MKIENKEDFEKVVNDPAPISPETFRNCLKYLKSENDKAKKELDSIKVLMKKQEQKIEDQEDWVSRNFRTHTD